MNFSLIIPEVITMLFYLILVQNFKMHLQNDNFITKQNNGIYENYCIYQIIYSLFDIIVVTICLSTKMYSHNYQSFAMLTKLLCWLYEH